MGHATSCCQAADAEAEQIELATPQDELELPFDADIVNDDKDEKDEEIRTKATAAKAGEHEERLAQQALEEAERHLREFNLDRADAVLGAALDQLSEASAEGLRNADTFRRVQRCLGQYELAKEMLDSDGFELLWQQDNTRMEVKRDPSCRVFEYRLVIDLEQPLSQAMSHFEEVDLIHKDGFYRELQKIEKMRSPVPWDSRFLNRRWRLLPELQSATPPSLRKHAA